MKVKTEEKNGGCREGGLWADHLLRLLPALNTSPNCCPPSPPLFFSAFPSFISFSSSFLASKRKKKKISLRPLHSWQIWILPAAFSAPIILTVRVLFDWATGCQNKMSGQYVMQSHDFVRGWFGAISESTISSVRAGTVFALMSISQYSECCSSTYS